MWLLSLGNTIRPLSRHSDSSQQWETAQTNWLQLGVSEIITPVHINSLTNGTIMLQDSTTTQCQTHSVINTTQPNGSQMAIREHHHPPPQPPWNFIRLMSSQHHSTPPPPPPPSPLLVSSPLNSRNLTPHHKDFLNTALGLGESSLVRANQEYTTPNPLWSKTIALA